MAAPGILGYSLRMGWARAAIPVLLLGCQARPAAVPPATPPASANAPASLEIQEPTVEDPAAFGPSVPDDDDAPTEGVVADASQPAAAKYAALDRAACEAELDRRKIGYERVGEAKGVIAPLRLTGPLSGVSFRSNLSTAASKTSPYDIYDCRLVLSLDDFAGVLAKHGIVEVVHLSVYRPVGKKVQLKNGVGRRHSGALAIDAALFKTSDGKTLSVLKDFKGRIGTKPCPAPESATELRKIACEANEARLFNVLLTPDYNWAHRNHFHLEVTAGVGWTLVR